MPNSSPFVLRQNSLVKNEIEFSKPIIKMITIVVKMRNEKFNKTKYKIIKFIVILKAI
jgi:hypothetical protein